MLGNCGYLRLNVSVLNTVKVDKATMMIDVLDIQNIVMK